MIVRGGDHHRIRPAEPGRLQRLRLPPVAGDQGHVNAMQRLMSFLANTQIDRHHFEAHLRKLAHDAHAGMADADHDNMPLEC